LAGQNASPARELGKLQSQLAIGRELATGQTDQYTVTVKKMQFVRLVARQMGRHVAVSVLDPLGKTVAEAHRFNGTFGPEAASFIADVSGEYRVRVSNASGAAGRYRMESLELRAPTGDDRSRIEAEWVEFQAEHQPQAATREARLRSLELYQRARSIWRRLKDDYEEGISLYAIGRLYGFLDDNRKALEYYGQALPLFHAVGDQSGEAVILNRIGGIYYYTLGEQQRALDYYGQALLLARAVDYRSIEAAVLNNIGAVYGTLDEQQRALEYYGQALPLRRADGDRLGEATTLTNIGAIYFALGEQQKALDYHGQALPLYRAAGNRYGEATALNNIGHSYRALGERQKALDYYRQALSLRRAIGDRSGEAVTLNDIGVCYGGLGAWPKALEYFGQALPLSRAAGHRTGEGRTLDNIGVAYGALGAWPKALEYFGQALPLNRAGGDRLAEARTLNHTSWVFRSTRPELAILLAKQAVNLLQTIRRDNRELDESLRKTFEKSIESTYRYLAGLLVDSQRFGEAEEVLNLLKDKEAADFIRRDAVAEQLKAATLLPSERQALERYEQILTGIVSDGQAKSALVAKAANTALSAAESERDKQLGSRLSASNTVLLRFFDEQEKAFAPNSAAAKRVGELRESEGLQDTLQALGPDVVAIYTLVLPEKYTALLVTSGARKAYSTLIPEADLNRKIFDFRQQLQNPASNPLPLARELYQILFPEGLRQDLDAMGAKTIMWSIDSTIRYVPMAALHDGGQYLVSRFRNSLITPASLARLTEGSQTVWKGVGFGVSQAKSNFSALPSVPEELRRIFRQGESGDAPVPGLVRLDPDFTREAFEAAMRQPDKSVVHIATHFDSKPGVAANSHLLLGDGSQMSLAEIEATPRLFSGVDLLTLSACSTAFTNRSEDGREVDSFGTIAQRLGARGVIASLWSVNDEATARLMETMYRIRQSQPALGKSEALRRAQEQLASGILKPEAGDAGDRGVRRPGGRAASEWTHPYYWAPFILIGNWK
jgi:CHAT domain-containing protein/tetratricopeptide (TPR) repeat protein